MKKLALGAAALLLFTSTAALAQRNDNQNGRGDNQNDRRDDDSRYSNQGPNDRGGRNWSRGDRIPREYMQPRYVHNGWQQSGLRRPARGQAWYIMGNQFVLISTRTGVIVEIAAAPQRGQGQGWGYGGDRDELWRNRYQRSYTYNDDVAYAECHNKVDPAGVFAGAILGGLLGNAVAGRGDRTGATVAGVIAGGAVGVALTNKLDCGDRSYAYQNYSTGFNSGRVNATYKWTNPQNQHRGELKVLDYYNDEDRFRCAVFTQTVYIGNRREEARGRACQQPNGTWVIID